MADRIGKMEQDQAAFTASVRAFVEQLGDAFDAGQAVAVNDGLSDRLGKAIHDRKACGQCLEEMESVAKDIAEVETSLVELRAVAAEMFKAFGVDSLREVDESLKKGLFRVSSGWHRPRAGKQATALEDRRSMECRLGRTRADGGKVARSSYPLSLV